MTSVDLGWPWDGVMQVRQYLVKLRGHSYNRLEWQREDEIEADGKLSKNALSRFLRKLATGEPIDREYMTYTQTLRIIGHRTEGGFGKEYLVKWGGLPYCECSWEYAYSVPAAAIDAYNVASNRLAVEAAKLQRDRDLGWLQKGRTLEAWPASDPLHELHGAWYGATALSLHETYVYIEYKHLLANEEDVDAGSHRERVPVHRVRPLPPKTTRKDFRPEVGEVVSAEHLNGWWSGRVLAIAKRGEVLSDLRGAAVRAMEQQQLLQPPLNASDPSLSVGQTAEGRDGRQWQLLALEGSQRRIWQLLGSAVHSQLLGGALASANADEPPPSAVAVGVSTATVSAEAAAASEDETRGGEGGGGGGGGGTRRTSSRSDKAPPPTKQTTNAHFLRGISRSELPGSRIVVVYTEEADVSEAMPEGGPELCGHVIEVHWPIDRAWYRCRVLRVVPGRRQLMYEVLYVDDDVRETLDLAKEEWRHVNAQVRMAYPGLLIKPTEVDGVPSLLVHFDGMESTPESAECFVDEDGEDEWLWESEFRPSKGVRVFKPEPLVASETMWFISGDGESSLAPISAPPPLLLRLPLGAEMGTKEGETAGGGATSAPAVDAEAAPTATITAMAAVDAVSLPVEAPYGSGGDLASDLASDFASDLASDLAMVLDSGAYASTEPVVSAVVSAGAAAEGASSASAAVATVISVSDVVSDAAECQRTKAEGTGGAAAPMVVAAIVGTASDTPAAKASAHRPPSALQSWKPLSALRPNWRWSGVDATGNVTAGWREGATMEDGMPIEPRKAGDPFGDVEEEEEDEAKLAAATAAEKAAADKAAAGKAAADKAAADKAAAKKRRAEEGEEYVDEGGGGGRRNGEAGEEEEESDSEEGEDETAIEVSGWKRLHSSPPVPSGRVLRPYQLEGVNWMRLNWYLGRNIILGDEMGLGKTAQSCMLLHTLRRFEHVEGPFLIVVPLSTLPHWERELSLWTDCYTVVYHGSAESRRVLLQWDWKLATPKMLPVDPSKPEGKKREYKYRFHCVLTTYETVVRHRL